MLSVVLLRVVYAECHFAECHYAECRGAIQVSNSKYCITGMPLNIGLS
jgi:hypothetical protein